MSRKYNILNNVLTILFTVGSVFVCVAISNSRYSVMLKDIILFYIIGLIVATIVVTVVHETGHLIAGLLNGFSMISVKILFIRFFKENKKIKCEFCGILNSIGATEMVSKKQEGIEKRFAKFSAGGLIFSVVPLAIGILSLFIVGLPYQIFAILSVFLPVTLYSVFGNGLPTDEYGVRNDGGVLLGLKRKDDHTKVLLNLIKIQSELFNGKTPKEVDEKLYFDLPQLPEDDNAFITLLSNRYAYYLDKKDYENAKKTVNRLLTLTEYMDKPVETAIKTDALFSYCTFDFDEDKADELMYELEDYLNKYNTVANVRAKLAYISFVIKDDEQVNGFYKKALREAKKCPYEGLCRFEKDLIEGLKRVD